jgi:hypothetical protein
MVGLSKATGSNRPKPGTRDSEMTAAKQSFAACGKLALMFRISSRTNFFVLVAVTVGLVACYRLSWYDGDGQLTDAGWQAIEGNRYKLDLGAVDLTVPGTRTYRLDNLPSAEFTVGLEILEGEPIQMNSAPPGLLSLVRIELTNSNDQVAILEEGPLDTWVRSYALGHATSFLYRRGESKDIPIGNGATQGERIGIKAENGWGTYFTAGRSGTYSLKFQVIDPRSAVKTAAHLVLHGT